MEFTNRPLSRCQFQTTGGRDWGSLRSAIVLRRRSGPRDALMPAPNGTWSTVSHYLAQLLPMCFSTVLSQKGGLIIYGQASAAAWQALPLEFYSTVLTVDMVLFGTKAGRVIRRGGRGRRRCCCLLACPVCANHPPQSLPSIPSSQTHINSDMSPVCIECSSSVVGSANNPVLLEPLARPVCSRPSSLVNRDPRIVPSSPGQSSIHNDLDPVDSYGEIAAPRTPHNDSTIMTKLDCSWVKDNRHMPDHSVIRICSSRFPICEVIDMFRIVYSINKRCNHHSPKVVLQLFETCVVSAGTRWLSSRQDIARLA